MKAMIFAAGLGTRLGDMTLTKPKALADINGRTMLGLTAEKLVAAGFDDLLVNIHHHPEQMLEEIDRLRSRGHKITVSDERDEQLDTAGGLYRARAFFGSEPGAPDYGATVFGTAGGVDPITGETLLRSFGHIEYFSPNTESLRNLALITIGHGADILAG